MPAFEPWRAVLAVLLLVYVGALLVLGLRSRRQIRDVADYLVAGRRLSTPLTVVTLLATWFGAGTVLTATDEIRAGGLRRAALDPIGAGLCLVVCGWFFAGPLWRAQLLTLPDWYGRRFGPRAERLAAVGLYSPRGGETADVTSMATGTGVWLVHLVLGWEAFLGPWLAPAPPIPMELAAFAAGAVAYPLGARWAGGVGDAGRS